MRRYRPRRGRTHPIDHEDWSTDTHTALQQSDIGMDDLVIVPSANESRVLYHVAIDNHICNLNLLVFRPIRKPAEISCSTVDAVVLAIHEPKSPKRRVIL